MGASEPTALRNELNLTSTSDITVEFARPLRKAKVKDCLIRNKDRWVVILYCVFLSEF